MCAKCFTCKSENLEFLQNGKSILRNYRKVQGNITEEGQYIYPTSEYLCLDCGFIMQIMEEGVLQNYNKEKRFFR